MRDEWLLDLDKFKGWSNLSPSSTKAEATNQDFGDRRAILSEIKSSSVQVMGRASGSSEVSACRFLCSWKASLSQRFFGFTLDTSALSDEEGGELEGEVRVDKLLIERLERVLRGDDGKPKAFRGGDVVEVG